MSGFNRLILGLDVTVGILLGKDAFCRNFILCAVATFWAISLVGIYHFRASFRPTPRVSKPFLPQSSTTIAVYLHVQVVRDLVFICNPTCLGANLLIKIPVNKIIHDLEHDSLNSPPDQLGKPNVDLIC